MSGRGRGRGRGRRGGGHRGRSRGGRGAMRGGMGRQHVEEVTDQNKVEEHTDLDIEKEPKDYFVGTVSMADHVKGQEQNRTRYAAAMAVLANSGVAVSQNARVRALAAAWARSDYDLSDGFLQNREQFGLVEVLKALTLLDSGRQIRVLEKRMTRLLLSGTKVSKKKMGKIKADLGNLKAIKPPTGSASGATCKHITRWVRNFTTQELEFYALYFPKQGWKKLADICHFNPKEDFPALPWFLPFCYGGPAPDNTMVERCQNLTPSNVDDLVKEYDIPYSVMKAHVESLTPDSMTRVAAYEKLDTILWYYEDLQCLEVDAVVKKRLEEGHKVSLPNGKLLERLLTLKMIRENIPFDPSYSGWDVPRIENPTKACFHPALVALAEDRLNSIKLNLESPVVVMGDASGSMDVAVRTSTIIASLLTAATSAKLVFFNEWTRDAPYLPKTVEQCLELAVTIRAEGGTAPAASLYPYYKEKEVVKTFIVVTDEEEMDEYEGYRFCPLFKKYHTEVYPAKLVFVSFLQGQHREGRMVKELKEEGFKPLQYRLETNRPDLTKLDNLFGMLASNSTEFFEDEIKEMEFRIQKDGLKSVFKSTTAV
ncbi:uncharacterized protein LOC124279819 [Haliotis rubra]|uniref:uncharacterized protein LOC124279819 n=1 Tax=Haliotis rubra TaxID=36100 RepID=UPI001EE57102|nr:uncharacterized protein LOC124279819 [Haliotis rubra]